MMTNKEKMALVVAFTAGSLSEIELLRRCKNDSVLATEIKELSATAGKKAIDYNKSKSTTIR